MCRCPVLTWPHGGDVHLPRGPEGTGPLTLRLPQCKELLAPLRDARPGLPQDSCKVGTRGRLGQGVSGGGWESGHRGPPCLCAGADPALATYSPAAVWEGAGHAPAHPSRRRK